MSDAFVMNGGIQSVPQRKHPVSMTIINWSMLFIVEIKLNTNILCGKNAELLIVRAGDTYSHQWTLKD